MLLANFFFTSKRKQIFFFGQQRPTIFFYVSSKKFFVACFPYYVCYNLVFFLVNIFFINFDNNLLFSAHIFNKLFFSVFCGDKLFFSIFLGPPSPPPPDIKWYLLSAFDHLKELETTEFIYRVKENRVWLSIIYLS